MVASLVDVPKVTLVLLGLELLKTPEEVEAFTSVAGTEVVIGSGLMLDPQAGSPSIARTLSLPRDRILLETSASRSSIARDYPLFDDIDRLAEVADHALVGARENSRSAQALGYNVELVYDQDSDEAATLYLARRIFGTKMSLKDEWSLIGGSAKFHFSDGTRQWNIGLEPRFNDGTTARVFCSVNVHHDEVLEVPSREEIADSVREAWHEADAFVSRLDGTQL